LQGGVGSDLMTGGAGADTFRYLTADDSTMAAPDVILDFATGVDKIDLRSIHTSAADSFNISSSGGNSFVDVDLGGNGSIDLHIQVSGTNSVAASDILWLPASGSTAAAGEVSSQANDDAELVDHSTLHHSYWMVQGEFDSHYGIA